MPQSNPQSKVTIETLLRLKRLERPSPEFWTQFEAELREKQLAALVQRRTWWQKLPHLLPRRAFLPIGAAAVLTFTLVSVRVYGPSEIVQSDAEFSAHESRSVAPVNISSSVAASAPVVAEARPEIVATPEEIPEPAAAVRYSEQLPKQVRELLSWSAPRVEDSPSARSIAANLARLEETEPELVNSLLAGHGQSHERSVQIGAATAMEMVAVSAVGSRRNRLLAHLSERQFSPDPSAPEVVRERLTRRLGDTDSSSEWTRVGLKADRVSLKF